MYERALAIIFIILCIGQIWALRWGRLTAVAYYISVASLQYFSLWMFVTWSPDRVCGLLLILGTLVFYRKPESIYNKSNSLLFVFFAYIVIITLLSSFFWPVSAMRVQSAAYGPLRAYIQIFNWGVVIGSAWQIALALGEKEAFDKIRNWFIGLGTFHCSVALYQVVAYWSHLPVPGIRRVAVGVGLDFNDPQLAIATIGGLGLYRPTSFTGEPRSLAGVSMLWIAALFTLYTEGRISWYGRLCMAISLIVLVLTLSTSGWGGFFCCVASLLYLISRQKGSGLGGLFILALMLGILLTVDSTGWLPESVSVKTVFEDRWSKRLSNPFEDLPVKMTLDILSDNPQVNIWGAGAGGMSFYIANRLGGSELIYASTVSFVNFIGDLGLVGLFLMLAAMWGGARNFLSNRVNCDPTCRNLAFMGFVFLCQYLISAPSYMLATSFGFLLASQFRFQVLANSLTNINDCRHDAEEEDDAGSH